MEPRVKVEVLAVRKDGTHINIKNLSTGQEEWILTANNVRPYLKGLHKGEADAEILVDDEGAIITYIKNSGGGTNPRTTTYTPKNISRPAATQTPSSEYRKPNFVPENPNDKAVTMLVSYVKDLGIEIIKQNQGLSVDIAFQQAEEKIMETFWNIKRKLLEGEPIEEMEDPKHE